MRDDDVTGSPAGDQVERMTGRVVNSLVIAAGVIALGLYAGGGGTEVEAPDYQIVSTTDGRVVRLNTDTGSIVSCDAARCRLIQMRSDDLEDEFERARETPQRALPPPVVTPQDGSNSLVPENMTVPAAPPAPQPAPSAQPPAQPQP